MEWVQFWLLKDSLITENIYIQHSNQGQNVNNSLPNLEAREVDYLEFYPIINYLSNTYFTN